MNGQRCAFAAVATVLVITLHCDRAFGQVPARAAIKPAAASGKISGVVAAADSGARLSRARVRLTASVTRQSVTQVTDARGQYEFRDLAPGRYTVTASKGAYVQAQYGQVRPFAPGTPIELSEGQEIRNADIRLPPGATIDGRVFDEFGEPIADAVVMTLRAQYLAGMKRVVNVGRILTTNERGEFHLFGLPPGSYYLSANLLGEANAADAAARQGYAPTYYPGSTDLGAAEPISVGVGEQRAGLDIVLTAMRTVSISGVVSDSEGRPFGSGTLTIVNSVSGVAIPVGSAPIAPDGSFKVSNAPPGRFTLNASTGASTVSNGSREVATQPIVIGSDDVVGFNLHAPKPALISGLVVKEDGDTEPVPAGVQLRVFSANPAEDLADMGAILRTNSDGSFQNAVRPGRVRVELAGSAPGWYVSRILLGSRDVTDEGIELRSDTQVNDIRVCLTRQVSVISGDASDAAGRPARDYVVSIFAKNDTEWGFRSRRVAAAKSDQEGRFVLRGLPAGEYYVAALDYLEQGEAGDPEVLQAIRDNARLITIAAAESKVLKLQVNKR